MKFIIKNDFLKYNGDMYKIESIENDDGKNYTLTIFANRNEM